MVTSLDRKNKLLLEKSIKQRNTNLFSRKEARLTSQRKSNKRENSWRKRENMSKRSEKSWSN